MLLDVGFNGGADAGADGGSKGFGGYPYSIIFACKLGANELQGVP